MIPTDLYFELVFCHLYKTSPREKMSKHYCKKPIIGIGQISLIKIQIFSRASVIGIPQQGLRQQQNI